MRGFCYPELQEDEGMSKILTALTSISCLLFAMEGAWAATRGYSRMSEYSGSRATGGIGHMTADLSAHYVRDTQPDGLTDTAARLSLGGMFATWIGLDLVGMFATKSKDYLVGTDLRLTPTEWFFVKGGLGSYADKKTREFKSTPLAGAGINAGLGDGYYLVSEFTYFERATRKNVTFGAGVGMTF